MEFNLLLESNVSLQYFEFSVCTINSNWVKQPTWKPPLLMCAQRSLYINQHLHMLARCFNGTHDWCSLDNKLLTHHSVLKDAWLYSRCVLCWKTNLDIYWTVRTSLSSSCDDWQPVTGFKNKCQISQSKFFIINMQWFENISCCCAQALQTHSVLEFNHSYTETSCSHSHVIPHFLLVIFVGKLQCGLSILDYNSGMGISFSVPL